MEWSQCIPKESCARWRQYFKNGRVTGEAAEAQRAKITLWVEEEGILGVEVELGSLPSKLSQEVVLEVATDNQAETFYVDSNSLMHVERRKKRQDPTSKNKRSD